jgi:hypothetical protein
MLSEKEKNSSCCLFLGHYLFVLRDNMKELSPMSKAPNGYELGRSKAYYEIAKLFEESCKAFNLDINDLQVKDFDPEKLL